ncbi:MAG TPA: hypothetical protein PLL09_07955 [Flavobacterium sp.]|uniref:hypothetical protein n=1 Tax=unclassified Flavobacterium TaxID=196869 RepID=UPI0025C2127C|nr:MULTISPECIES: hypothetical protein [unclassified Flavobacterium]HRE77743.1 hypothetical protein [Flavobacterium sp.]
MTQLFETRRVSGNGDGNSKCSDCPHPDKYTHKNKEIFSSKDGNDYIFYNNEWHLIGKEEFVEEKYWDPYDPKGFVSVKVKREDAFEANFLISELKSEGTKSAVGWGSLKKGFDYTLIGKEIIKKSKEGGAGQVIKKKLAGTNIFWMSYNFHKASKEHAIQMFKSMERHDKAVELLRKKNKI